MSTAVAASIENATASGEAWALFVARAAHDLNNHLATILGQAEISLMGDDPARWRRGLQAALDAGREARTLVADLSLVAAWRLSDAAPAPLADILTVVVRATKSALTRRKVQLVGASPASFTVLESPGDWALAMWLLVHDGVQRAGVNRDQLTWRLDASESAEGAWAVSFITPGSRPSAASGALGLVRELVEARGGRLDVDGELSRITFSR